MQMLDRPTLANLNRVVRDFIFDIHTYNFSGITYTCIYIMMTVITYKSDVSYVELLLTRSCIIVCHLVSTWSSIRRPDADVAIWEIDTHLLWLNMDPSQ